MLSPVTGWIVDRYGGRWVIAGAGLTMAIALVFLSGLQALWQLYLFYAIGRGLSMSSVSNVGFVAVSNWFVRKRPMVIGLVMVSQRVGMGLLPLYVAVVISVAGDWRAGWIALAAVALVFGVVPPALLIRRRPEDLGLRPDGDPPLPRRESGPVPIVDEDDFTLREAVRTRAYWFMGIAVGLMMFTSGSINFHQIPFLVDRGFGSTDAALIVAVFSAVGALGGLIGGFLAARLTARRMLIISLIGMALGPLLLLQTEAFSTALVYAAVYGMFFGSGVAMNQAIYADYFGRTSLGVIRGSFQPVQLVLNAAGPFLTGLWVDRAGSYDLPFLVFSAVLLGSATLLILAPHPRRPESSSRAPSSSEPSSREPSSSEPSSPEPSSPEPSSRGPSSRAPSSPEPSSPEPTPPVNGPGSSGRAP